MGDRKQSKGVSDSCEWVLTNIDVNRVGDCILHHNKKGMVVFPFLVSMLNLCVLLCMLFMVCVCVCIHVLICIVAHIMMVVSHMNDFQY